MAGKTRTKSAGSQPQGSSEALIPGRGCGGVIRITAAGIISIVRQAACAVDGAVMEDDDMVVRRVFGIEFNDVIAFVNGGLEGGEGVFRIFGTDAAVGLQTDF